MSKLDKYQIIFSSLFQEKSNNTFVQLIRYTFVGGTAFIVDFGVLLLLTEKLKMHYLISAGVSFLFGLLINYLLSINWVFSGRKLDQRWLEFLIFLSIGLIGLALNELFIWVLTDLLLIYYIVSKIITTAIVCFWNFFARKIVLFNK